MSASDSGDPGPRSAEEPLEGAWTQASGPKLSGYASPLDLGLGLGLALLVALLPSVTGFRGTLPNIVLFLGIYMILAQGLNVVVGFTGLLDLGYVVFLATGAVVTAFLASIVRLPDGSLDWPIGKTEAVVGEALLGFDGSILPILFVAGLLCALIGVLRGIPTLRVRGDYYAIVTLGFAEIMYETFLWDESNPFEGNPLNMTRITGGAFGVKLESQYRPRLFGDALYYDTPQFYYLVLLCVIATFLVVHHLNRSRVGRALAAIRLDETAARSCGVNVSHFKIIAFAVSGFVGGIGGGLYAIWSGTVAVKALDVWQSILILCCIVLGGMGSIRGVAVGTVILMSLGELLREQVGGITIPPEARFLIYGVLLIAVMRFRPQGILPPVGRGRPLDEEEHAELAAGAAPLYALDAGPEASS
jgi:branched-chain amino acid transport system permease protein